MGSGGQQKDIRVSSVNLSARLGQLTSRAGPRPPGQVRSGATEPEPRRVKLTVVGDGTVGKTCLLYAFVNRSCPADEYIPTVFENTTLDWCVDTVPVQLSLWDTAGQEEYCRLRRLIYPSTDIFVLCYAVDNTSSFENVSCKWWPELREFCPKTPILLVATKTDLRGGSSGGSSEEVVTSAQGRRLARRLRAAGFRECSARHCTGVQEVFDDAVRGVLRGTRSRLLPCGQRCSVL